MDTAETRLKDKVTLSVNYHTHTHTHTHTHRVVIRNVMK